MTGKSVQKLNSLVNEIITEKPNAKNIGRYCRALQDIGIEKHKISQKVKSDIDHYDPSTLNHFIPKQFKNSSQSKNSKIGVLKRKLSGGVKSLAEDMTNPIKEMNHATE